MQKRLSIRSAKAHDLAHRLARAEGRTIVSVVERALEAYANRHREPAEVFYRRLSRAAASEHEGTDLTDLADANRKPHSGLDL